MNPKVLILGAVGLYLFGVLLLCDDNASPLAASLLAAGAVLYVMAWGAELGR